jgi:hypothetical protein
MTDFFDEKRAEDDFLFKAEKAIYDRDRERLESLLHTIGFTNKIEPHIISRFFWYCEHTMLKQEKNLTIKDYLGFGETIDRTNYLLPYCAGFVLRDANDYYACYGRILEIFVEKSFFFIEPREPHDFFFIKRLKKDQELYRMLIEQARKSPGNPASWINRALMTFGLNNAFHKNSLDSPYSITYGINGILNYLYEIQIEKGTDLSEIL